MKHIPNILSVFRLLMIPVFVFVYFEYDGYIAAGIYVLAWITDALDGYLARRNNWITDIGKILDPLADKLMQLAAAVCFAIENPVFWAVAVPLFLKELAMLIGGVIVIKRKHTVTQALWYGKLATIILFVCAFLKIIIRNNQTFDITICAIMLTTLLFALIMYYLKVFKGNFNETNRKQ